MRCRAMLATMMTVLVGTAAGAVLGPPPAASAVETALGRCYQGERPQFADPLAWSAPGNVHTTWPAPMNLMREDALRVTANGTIRIDHWGTNKNINGESPAAGSGWPAPAARRYMLIARVTMGSMWLRNTGLTYGSSDWFPVGADSGCMLYSSAGSGGQLVFSFNDPNLGDNGGGASVHVKQWWGLL